MVKETKKGIKNMSYKVTGVAKVVGDVKEYGAKNFKKSELVVTVETGKFPQYISIEFVQEKSGLLDGIEVGTEVEVSFDLSGREYNGKYYTSLQGWRITRTCEGDASGIPDGFDDPAYDDDVIPF